MKSLLWERRDVLRPQPAIDVSSDFAKFTICGMTRPSPCDLRRSNVRQHHSVRDTFTQPLEYLAAGRPTYDVLVPSSLLFKDESKWRDGSLGKGKCIMQIYGASNVHSAHAINQPHAVRPSSPARSEGGLAVTDELNISTASQFIEQAQQLPAIRQDRVDAIRQAISQGAYETADKLDVALDRLLDEIA